jgi:PAS domain S-box-containing protein
VLRGSTYHEVAVHRDAANRHPPDLKDLSEMPIRAPITLPPSPQPSSEDLGAQVRRLLAEAQALSARLAALNELTTAIQITLDRTQVFQALANQARWLIDFQHCSIALLDGHSYQVLALQRDQPPIPSGRFPLSHGIIGRALRNRHEIRQLHLAADAAAPPGMQSALIVPLRNGVELIGTLNFFATNPQQYSLDDLRIAAALAAQVSVSLQNARLHAAVSHARDELHTVLESISDGVLVLDGRGRVLLLNSAIRQLFGLAADVELSGKRALQLLRSSTTQQIDREALIDVLENWATAPEDASTGSIALGNGIHVEWARAPLISTGVHQGAVITLRDISPRVALEKLRADMTSLLVHDLRTPLTSVMMGLDLLNMYRDEPELFDLALFTIRSASRQMLDHVNTILDLSRLESGQLEPDCAPTAITMVIENTLTPLRPLAQQAEQQLSTAIDADLPLLVVDATLIGRVLANLVGNALKFTPTGGSVVVGATRLTAEAQVEIWVRDTGPGIPEALHTQIFEKYGQVRREDRQRGSGMGLFFCRLAVEAHHGQIGVRSAPDGGSIFWLRLPL